MEYVVLARVDNENHVVPADEVAVHSAAEDCTCGPEPHLRVSDETGEARWTWLHLPMAPDD